MINATKNISARKSQIETVLGKARIKVMADDMVDSSVRNGCSENNSRS